MPPLWQQVNDLHAAYKVDPQKRDELFRKCLQFGRERGIPYLYRLRRKRTLINEVADDLNGIIDEAFLPALGYCATAISFANCFFKGVRYRIQDALDKRKRHHETTDRIEQLRRAGVDMEQRDEPVQFADAHAEDDVINQVARSHLMTILRTCIERIRAKRQKEVGRLRFVEGLERDEIADHLGISESTVRVHLSRALSKLQVCMGGMLEELRRDH